MPRRRNITLQVGVLVALAIAVLVMIVFVLGDQRSLFSSKTRLHTSFADINGLVVGAPVRLAGVDVGRVSDVSFGDDLSRAEARLELAIEDRYMPRVRRDSRAFIDSKGLLGDKIINLTVGSPSAGPLQDGDEIKAGQGPSLEQLAQRVDTTAAAIGQAAVAAEGAVSSLASPEITENIRRITAALAAVLEEMQHGQGLAHALIYDRAPARRVSAILGNLESASADARSVGKRLDGVLAALEQGPGTLHSLLYGHEGQALMADLAELGDRLNRISAQVEAGQGTVGGLLVDPSVYEDMKTVLGNVERNVVFKALVRMTLKEGNIQRPAQVARPTREP